MKFEFPKKGDTLAEVYEWYIIKGIINAIQII